MELAVDRVVSEPTLRRLPLYHHYLRGLLARGQEAVSATRIAEELGLDPTQVRKDLAVTGLAGRPRVGFSTAELMASIASFLGWNNVTEAFLVGVGNLGAALLSYDGFADYGLRILAGFEVDEAKIGRRVGGKEVFALAKLPSLVRRMHVRIIVLTVPASAAQSVTDLAVEAGVEAIWNFAPVHLQVPPEVIIEHTHLFETLAALSRALGDRARPATP